MKVIATQGKQEWYWRDDSNTSKNQDVLYLSRKVMTITTKNADNDDEDNGSNKCNVINNGHDDHNNACDNDEHLFQKIVAMAGARGIPWDYLAIQGTLSIMKATMLLILSTIPFVPSSP